MKALGRACLGCGAPTPRARSLPLCESCSERAEALFRASHSPGDRDWIAARNRFWGRPAVVAEALRTAGDI